MKCLDVNKQNLRLTSALAGILISSFTSTEAVGQDLPTIPGLEPLSPETKRSLEESDKAVQEVLENWAPPPTRSGIVTGGVTKFTLQAFSKATFEELCKFYAAKLDIRLPKVPKGIIPTSGRIVGKGYSIVRSGTKSLGDTAVLERRNARGRIVVVMITTVDEVCRVLVFLDDPVERPSGGG